MDTRECPYYNRLTRAQVSYNIRKTCPCNMSRVMRKPESCIYVKNKGALFSLQKYNNFSTYIQASGLLLYPSVWPSSVTVHSGLCRIWSETQNTGFLASQPITSLIHNFYSKTGVDVPYICSPRQFYGGVPTICFEQYIFCPCNIQMYFAEAKIEKFY